MLLKHWIQKTVIKSVKKTKWLLLIGNNKNPNDRKPFSEHSYIESLNEKSFSKKAIDSAHACVVQFMCDIKLALNFKLAHYFDHFTIKFGSFSQWQKKTGTQI